MIAAVALLATAAPAQDDPAALTRAASAATARARAIEARVAAEDRAADRALGDAARAAARVAAAETRAAAARRAVAGIDRQRAAQQRRLAAARAPLARLAAALQVMARRPTALAVAAPGSTDDLIHLRLTLDAALPLIARRTAALRAEIVERDRLRVAAAGAVTSRDAATAALARERRAFLALADTRRARAAGLSGDALAASDRALALAADAREATLSDATRDADAALLRDLATLPPPAPRRPAPAATTGDWTLPVAGRLATGFGEVTEEGVRSRGIALATAPGATVRAPAPGRIAWAGPFPGYGAIVILAQSGGRTTLVAGLARIAVREGDVVAPGDRLGAASRRVTLEVRRGETPVDLAALARAASARARDPVSPAP